MPLREKIAEQYPHLGLTPAEIVVMVGSQEAMTALFCRWWTKATRSCCRIRSFPAYDACVRLAEGKPVYYRLPADKDFAFDIEEFRSKITPKTKAAVVISPSNPTGKIFTRDDLQGVADCLKDTGIYLISDEIYSDLYFTGEAPASASEYYDKTLIVSGLSKSLSMTGWRLGWLASQQKDVMKAALTLHGFLTVCTSAISQKASLLAWTAEAQAAKHESREIYKKRGKYLVDLFQSELGLRGTSPEGAFYTMVDVRHLGDDIEVAEKFLANRVITVPGVAFGSEAKGFLRVSFCNTEEKMAEGVKRMKEVLE